MIFFYLLEQDLCRVSQVCKRFQAIANDKKLWKSLYQQVYEYDLLLFNSRPCEFEFISPNKSEYQNWNPWKESFRQLYRSIHVRLGFQNLKFKGRNLLYFNTVKDALDHVNECRRNSNNSSSGNAAADGQSCSNSNSQTNGEDASSQHLVFFHAGTHRAGFMSIYNDVALIGAAPGNVAKSVILEYDRESKSTLKIMFTKVNARVYVRANPLDGIIDFCMANKVQGTYEDNESSRNT